MDRASPITEAAGRTSTMVRQQVNKQFGNRVQTTHVITRAQKA